jgi:hypothetical protein
MVQLVMNSRYPEWVVSALSELDAKRKCVSPVAMVGLHR